MRSVVQNEDMPPRSRTQISANTTITACSSRVTTHSAPSNRLARAGTHAHGGSYHAQKYVDGQLSESVWIVTEWRLRSQRLSNYEWQRRRILKRYRTHERATKVGRRTCHPANDGDCGNGTNGHLRCGSDGEHPCIGQNSESEAFCQGRRDECGEKHNHAQL